MMCRKGFTLVELSIVLVIIGLIVGGIIGAQGIVRNAEITGFITEVNQLKSHVQQFKDAYNALPGDMRNASTFFTGATNGNGDTIVSDELHVTVGLRDEAFRVFSHLVAAEIISGTYLGTYNNAFNVDVNSANRNVMRSQSDDRTALYFHCCGDGTLAYNNNIVVFRTGTSASQRYGAFTPVEARGVDTKMDDGIPDAGFVGAIGQTINSAPSPDVYTSANCYSGTGGGSSYLTADEGKLCQMTFAYDWD